MVDLSPFCSFLLLAETIVVRVVFAVRELVCAVLAVLRVRGVSSYSVRLKMCIGVARVCCKASHGGPLGRGRG